MNETLTLQTVNTYDQMPYESHPYWQSNPKHLKTMGTLFGMNPVPLAKAKILELGCAAGGNLIPFACEFPKSECVGIDLSSVQVNEGQSTIDALKLKNIKLHNMSITDIDESFGKFDYIIVHGVISWVPENVREKIFEICKKNLTPNGIAYISYNTLPGWNMVRSLRDMMLYHCAPFKSDKEKVDQARFLLQFMREATENANSPYAKFLESEVKLLENQTDYYLRHDHLEENNFQFYFHEFMQNARQNGLQYLSDAHVSSMYLGNLPKKAAEKLSEIKEIVRTEQYMDYVTNRRFRCTLLCHDSVKLSRNISNEDIEKFYLTFPIYTESNITQEQVNDPMYSALFYLTPQKNTGSFSTVLPALKAILAIFQENINNPLKVTDAINLAAERFPDIKKSEIKTEFYKIAMRFVLSGYIKISGDPRSHSVELTDKPKVHKLARAQSEKLNNVWVTNLNHQTVRVSPVEKFVLRYLDGTVTKEDLIDKLFTHVQSNELQVKKEGLNIEDEKSIKVELEKAVDIILTKLPSNALLEL